MESVQTQIIKEFKKLSEIPRPSFHLEKVKEYLKTWARDNEWAYREDTYGNVCIVIGEEGIDKNNIIIQSHMDIVSAKTEQSNHNFATDPIELIFDYENNKLTANNTTLGADNGISLVSSLLLCRDIVVNDKSVIYLLITADEEEGMMGARNIDGYPFLPENASLINIDSEEKNEICVGCGGGLISEIKFSNEMKMTINMNYYVVKLEINNFKGGHSGCDINKGRANAIKVIGLILNKIKQKFPVTHVISIDGGSACNAIPADAKSLFEVSDTYDINKIRDFVNDEILDYSINYNENLETSVVKIEFDESQKIYEVTKTLDFINIVHQGVIDIESSNESCVRTSSNVGKIVTENDVTTIEIATRSSDIKSMEDHEILISTLTKLCGGNYNRITMFSGWPNTESNNKLIRITELSHEESFGFTPKKYTVHAGLEVGILLQKYNGWNAVSFGPQINDAHSVNEHIELDTIKPFYEWLKDVVSKLME
jgi:dipeptidase D